jgi:thiosulfate/3-mercaptopyruvate sulfurtransferase
VTSNPDLLVDTAWLAAHLGEPGLRVYDCTTHLIPDPVSTFRAQTARPDWERGHVPGAGYLDLTTDLSDSSSGLRFTFPPPAQFARAMSAAGVGPGTRVVLYAGGSSMWATRVWWMLRAFGFEDAAVLNGGWAKWKSEGQVVSTEPSHYPPATFIPRPRPELIAGKEDVLAAIEDERVCLINALSEPEYTGDPDFPHHYGRPGHIPGSVNVPFVSVVDMAANNQLIAPQALRKQFENAGALDCERVITYCGGGIASSQTAFLLTLLGAENVAVYDGSLTEWSADPTLPLVTGSTP